MWVKLPYKLHPLPENNFKVITIKQENAAMNTIRNFTGSSKKKIRKNQENIIIIIIKIGRQ